MQVLLPVRARPLAACQCTCSLPLLRCWQKARQGRQGRPWLLLCAQALPAAAQRLPAWQPLLLPCSLALTAGLQLRQCCAAAQRPGLLLLLLLLLLLALAQQAPQWAPVQRRQPVTWQATLWLQGMMLAWRRPASCGWAWGQWAGRPGLWLLLAALLLPTAA